MAAPTREGVNPQLVKLNQTIRAKLTQLDGMEPTTDMVDIAIALAMKALNIYPTEPGAVISQMEITDEMIEKIADEVEHQVLLQRSAVDLSPTPPQ